MERAQYSAGLYVFLGQSVCNSSPGADNGGIASPRIPIVNDRHTRPEPTPESEILPASGPVRFRTLRYLSSLGPTELISELWDFLGAWYATRNWKAILAIIPPLLLLMTLGGFVLAGRLRSKESLKAWYREQASEAVGLQLDGTPTENSDLLQKERTPQEEARVDLLFKRILQLGDDNQEARYFVAVHNLRQGKIAVARSMMESLAPADAMGLDLAHAWLAEDMYRRSVQGEAINPVVIKHHLKSSLENPRIQYDPLLYVLYAKLLEQESDIDGAARVLARASDQEPKLQLEPILLYARRGLGNQAIVTADVLIAKLGPKTTDPRISEEERIAAYLTIARAYQITNRVDETVPVLQKGLSIAPNHPDLRRTLSDTYRIKFRMSMSSAQGRGQASMDTLNAAIAADPTNIAIQSELSLLSQLGITSTQANREELIKLIARQGASTTVRMLLAESAFGRGDYAAAINDYELVLADLPTMTIALNNLAMLYTKIDPPRLDKAKETIDRAIALSPDVAEFLDTQGDVAIASGNAAAAIEAYNKALERGPERLQTRDKLIAIYEKENRAEDAQKQRELRVQVENRLKAVQEQMAKSQAANADALKQNAAPKIPPANPPASSPNSPSGSDKPAIESSNSPTEPTAESAKPPQ